MAKGRESLQEFYDEKLGQNPAQQDPGKLLFNVVRIEEQISSHARTPAYIRRDFYKIMLFQGSTVFHYPDDSVLVEGSTLLFFNPGLPYSYDPLDKNSKGFFCVFAAAFFEEGLKLPLNQLPLFRAEAHPVFSLDAAQAERVEGLFEKMVAEHGQEYQYKSDLIKSYVSELIYWALKLEPAAPRESGIDAGVRITSLFTELLDRQFPVEPANGQIELRSPRDFAGKLFLHVNSLNRAVKKTTGRTTTQIIFERLMKEAMHLLKHSTRNIAEISYALGFEDQSQFNHFFRKHSQATPTSFRKV